MIVRILLKSCATPPASLPIASIFWACRNCSSERLRSAISRSSWAVRSFTRTSRSWLSFRSAFSCSASSRLDRASASPSRPISSEPGASFTSFSRRTSRAAFSSSSCERRTIPVRNSAIASPPASRLRIAPPYIAMESFLRRPVSEAILCPHKRASSARISANSRSIESATVLPCAMRWESVSGSAFEMIDLRPASRSWLSASNRSSRSS